MAEYILLSDSSCDLPDSLVQEMGIGIVPFTVNLEGRTFPSTLDNQYISIREYYDLLRAKQQSTTAAINISEYIEFFESYLKAGLDILYLAFSSGLSSSYNASKMAAAELADQYPDRKIYCVDTLCASMGEGLLVYLTALEKQRGATLDQARDYVLQTRPHLCHWFTVEDLHHLKRGGRVSAATAIIGTALNIKPVLHVDDEGHLINMEKARGRRRSLLRMAEIAKETGIDLPKQTIFISHGDCQEDAEFLAEQMRAMGVADIKINPIGPVIGAHSGPGTVALFFLGKNR